MIITPELPEIFGDFLGKRVTGVTGVTCGAPQTTRAGSTTIITMTATATTTLVTTLKTTSATSTTDEAAPAVPAFDHDAVWRNVQRWRDAICERNARSWNLIEQTS